MEVSMPDLTLLLAAMACAALVLVTVLVYERIVRDLRRQMEDADIVYERIVRNLRRHLEDADIEAQMWSEIAIHARHRHPSGRGDQ